MGSLVVISSLESDVNQIHNAFHTCSGFNWDPVLVSVPCLSTYIYLQWREPCFYWKEGKCKAFLSFTRVVSTKSTETNVDNSLHMISFFFFFLWGAQDGKRLHGLSLTVLLIFCNCPVAHTVRLSSGWLWEANSARCCRKACRTWALEEDCLFLCGLQWNERKPISFQHLL